MKLNLLYATALAPLVSAHYFFDVLVAGGTESKSLQYIRENTRPLKYNPTKWVNTRDDMTPDLTDFRCNKGAFESAGKTQTYTVQAGSKLAMKLAVGATMKHPGPALVYMSKAPSTVSTYEGDGDWFKIYEESVCNTSADFTTNAWCTWDKDRVEFTVPADTPNGEYLIRSEHIGVHGAHVGEAEFYYACAQVKVTGGGTGVPGPTVKFPGAYKKDDPSFNFSIWNGYKPYPMPGPAVWTGGANGTTSAVNSTIPATNATALAAETAVSTSSLAPTATVTVTVTAAQPKETVTVTASADAAEYTCDLRKVTRKRRALSEGLRV